MCGIAGIVRKERSLFDFSTFCTLGIANDSRGGDSCGIFIDGEVEYGTGTYNKYFQNFMFDSKILQKTNSAKIAFLHCRKASVGAISEKTAQPVVIKDKTGEVRYVLMHNGTIYNYKELAEKYIPGVDITGMTDSQVMARIFYYKGYDALNEYQGGAVFAIVDYRQPEPWVLLWRGESKKYQSSKEKEEERPLFISTLYDEELVFSSIASYLFAQRPYSGVSSLPANRLFKWTHKKLTALKSYSRDNVGQWKSYTPATTDTSYYFPRSYVSGGSTYYSTYVSFKTTTRTYTLGGKELDGFYYMTRQGKIEDKKGLLNYPVSFFRGIPIRRQKYVRFLEKCLKKSRLTDSEFISKNMNFIRYLSCDRIYEKNGVMMEAIGPFECKPFSGKFQPLGDSWASQYTEGRFSYRISGSYDSAMKQLEDSEKGEEKLDLDKQLIKKICGA